MAHGGLEAARATVEHLLGAVPCRCTWRGAAEPCACASARPGSLLGAGVLFLIGTNVQAGWLFVLAALLLGALVAGLALAARAIAGLEVDVRAPAETRQGEDTPVDLRRAQPRPCRAVGRRGGRRAPRRRDRVARHHPAGRAR